MSVGSLLSANVKTTNQLVQYYLIKEVVLADCCLPQCERVWPSAGGCSPVWESVSQCVRVCPSLGRYVLVWEGVPQCGRVFPSVGGCGRY